jgi:NDP-sugar pyrophosphorylase family protein
MVVDIDLAQLSRIHHDTGALATLLLREDPRKQAFGTIGYQEDGAVRRITDKISLGSEKRSGLFTGIQLMSPVLLDRIPERAVSHLVADLYVPLLRAGERVSAAEMDTSAIWWPVGTPGELLDANLLALHAAVGPSGSDALRIDASARVEGRVDGPAWIGPSAHVAAGARLGPGVVMGSAAECPDGLEATEMLFLSAARPSSLGPLRRAIAFDREVWRDA